MGNDSVNFVSTVFAADLALLVAIVLQRRWATGPARNFVARINFTEFEGSRPLMRTRMLLALVLALASTAVLAQQYDT